MADLKLSAVAAIKQFFSTPERPVTMDEMRKLSMDERRELGAECCKALGAELLTTA